LSEAERARIIEVANEPLFAATPKARIVTALPMKGSRRRVQLPSRAPGAWPDEPQRASGIAPTDHANCHASGEVWCWDVTFLPAQIRDVGSIST